MLDAGTERAAVSLTLTAATENNTASHPSAGRDRPGVLVLSDTVDAALAAKDHTLHFGPIFLPVGREFNPCRVRPRGGYDQAAACGGHVADRVEDTWASPTRYVRGRAR